MNGLKEQWGDQVLVIQLNIHDRANRGLIGDLEANFTPTFVLFNLEGDAVWRQVGSIDSAAVSAEVDRLVDNGPS